MVLWVDGGISVCVLYLSYVGVYVWELIKMILNRILAGLMVIVALAYIMKDYVLIPIAIFILIIIIRFIADIYWWGKDRDKW